MYENMISYLCYRKENAELKGHIQDQDDVILGLRKDLAGASARLSDITGKWSILKYCILMGLVFKWDGYTLIRNNSDMEIPHFSLEAILKGKNLLHIGVNFSCKTSPHFWKDSVCWEADS